MARVLSIQTRRGLCASMSSALRSLTSSENVVGDIYSWSVTDLHQAEEEEARTGGSLCLRFRVGTKGGIAAVPRKSSRARSYNAVSAIMLGPRTESGDKGVLT